MNIDEFRKLFRPYIRAMLVKNVQELYEENHGKLTREAILRKFRMVLPLCVGGCEGDLGVPRILFDEIVREIYQVIDELIDQESS